MSKNFAHIFHSATLNRVLLKEQLRDSLKNHGHYKGNLSEFINECARAYVFQTRRGEEPVYPVEFVTAQK